MNENRISALHRWVYQKLALWTLVAILGYWLCRRWILGLGGDVITDMALFPLIVLLGGYVLISRVVLYFRAEDGETQGHRLAEFVAAPVLIALWFFISPVLAQAGFHRNLSRAISLGLIQDCERLVEGSPDKETALRGSERPQSIRAIRPFRVIVHPPVVRLLITTGLDNKRWMTIDPAAAKGEEPSIECNGRKEIAKGVYF